MLRAFRHGVMLVMPLLLATAIAILICNFPLPSYQIFMADTFGPGWREPCTLLYNSTVAVMALVTTFTFGECLVELHNQRRPEEAVLPVIGALTAFSCLLIMLGPTIDADGMHLRWVGLHGVFVSLVVTFCSCRVFLLLHRVRFLRISCYSEGEEPVLPHLLDVLLPVLLTLGFFIVLQTVLARCGIASVHQAFYNGIRALFADAGDSFGFGALYAFLVQLCWFLGIHGSDLLNPIASQMLTVGAEANMAAVGSGQLPLHIITKDLFANYVYIGGSGATLSLVAAIFIHSKGAGTRRMAYISLVPGLFNINELLLFGLPIILNPALVIPFLLTPLVLLAISYGAVGSGLAPMPVHEISWTTPPFINAYLATDSWRGVALQAFNFAVGTLIYIPFVDIAEKMKLAGGRKAFGALVELAATGTYGPAGKRLTDRPGSAGSLARSLAGDMAKSLDQKDGSVQLHYQPRVDLVQKSVPCVEALLRWDHHTYGMVPAPLTLAVSEDARLEQVLGDYIVALAFARQSAWRKEGISTTTAINIGEWQLNDSGFPKRLAMLFETYNLPAEAILLEVNECLALDPSARYQKALEALHMAGARLAVDDFGKGYQAMSYVERLPLSEVQIDRSLISNIAASTSAQEAIGTIQQRCMDLGIKTSAEFVESGDQLEALLELNCGVFQGYLFSKPISADECVEFIRGIRSQGISFR